MNTKILISAALALAGSLALGTAAHADTPLAVSATCDAVVITSPETGSTLLGVDAEPPMAVEAGTTLSYPFLEQADSHHWTVYVIADGAWTGDPQFLSGDVTGCGDAPVVDIEPISPPATQVVRPNGVTLSVWTDVALAPPW